MYALQAQPGEGGQKEVVQQAREDRAGDLQRQLSEREQPLRSSSRSPPYPLPSCGGPRTPHLILSLVYSNQEEQLGKEEVDAQVLVDGVAVGLQAPQEAEGGDADSQADQGDDNANPGDD